MRNLALYLEKDLLPEVNRWGTIVARGAQHDIGGAAAGGLQDAPGETAVLPLVC